MAYTDLSSPRDEVRSSALSTPLGKDSVVLLVLERIKEALISKELRPGDFLPSEEELARNLGVGKSSVREAVKMLQAIGVAEVLRGQGTVIRRELGEDILNPLIFALILEEIDISNLIDLRMMFEPAYSLMAMDRATPTDIEAIRATVDHFERVIADGTQTAEDDIAFHRAILVATHNPFVVRIGETILQLFTASIRRSMREIPDTALADHSAIFDAFLARDPQRLRDAILTSFEGWRRSLNKERAI